MKLRIVNRQGDAFPMLDITAENYGEGQQLKDLLEDMGKVQKYAIEYGVATKGYPLGAVATLTIFLWTPLRLEWY